MYEKREQEKAMDRQRREAEKKRNAKVKDKMKKNK